ncbi:MULTISPECIES: oligosaccharide flippase family protein [unclassified Arenibacter]|uniref:oligosaccharide flippase family protein n=1 Tax=unclassified Arenibacter TaxID=2615047 RepID=UPI000E34BFA3|nr:MULTISPECIES: oligosaccharide flippase family protein [unclassified Arenibacter]MCM4163335.1 polysaccharide biosynthesis protein [Arenibacter sp. A80]RFT57344.1 flippase [Arenibacter sp. P308M17]
MRGILKSRFIKNASIYTVADILNKLVPFVLLPVLTRYLTPSDYGIISMFTVFTSILGVFISLEMHGAISVKFFKLTKEELKIYIANVLVIVSVTTSLVLVSILIFHSYISNLLELPPEWLIIGVFVTCLTLFTTINLILWQSEHKPIPLGIYQITQTIFNLTLSLILIVGLGMGWEGRLIAASVAAILFGFLSFSIMVKRDFLKLKLNKAYLKDALKFGVPLLPHALSTWVRTGIDRVFLTMLVSTTATGLYTVGFQIASVIMVLTTAFDRAYSPFLFEKLKDITLSQKKVLVKYGYFYFLGLLLLASGLSLTAPYIVEIFLGKEFIESQKYITWFAFGFAFYGMYSVVVKFIFYTQKTIYLSYVTLIIGGLHIGLSYLFISYNGTIGAVQANTIISIITFLAVWWLSNKLLPMPWFKSIRTV